MSGHNWQPKRGGKRSTSPLPWLVCAKCLLVLLKNDATLKLAKKECPDDRW